MIESQQFSLKQNLFFKGISLHQGLMSSLIVKPAPINTGIVFVRTDLGEQARIKALAQQVTEVQRRTVLAGDGFVINTIEHLLAALYTQGIDNAICEINSPELPILDGSSKEFIDAILNAGRVKQNAQRKVFTPKKKLEFSDGDTWASLEPFDGLKITCSVSYGDSQISHQDFSLIVTAQSFIKELSQARTFCTYEELSYLFSKNLSSGGNLSNANILHGEKIYCRGKIRYNNELVRHKILDILGDFALLGYYLKANIKYHKPGHSFNNKIVKELAKLIEEK